MWNLKLYQQIFHTVTLKFISLCCPLNSSFAQTQCCNVMHWPFGNYWLTGVSTDFLNTWCIALYNVNQNQTTFLITTRLVRKVFKYREAVQAAVANVFSKILSFV